MRVSRIEVPCGVQGAGACRAQWAKQAGGALEIARSDTCVATMRVSRTRTPEQGLGRQPQHFPKKTQSQSRLRSGLRLRRMLSAGPESPQPRPFQGSPINGNDAPYPPPPRRIIRRGILSPPARAAHAECGRFFMPTDPPRAGGDPACTKHPAGIVAQTA